MGEQWINKNRYISSVEWNWKMFYLNITIQLILMNEQASIWFTWLVDINSKKVFIWFKYVLRIGSFLRGKRVDNFIKLICHQIDNKYRLNSELIHWNIMI